MKLNDHTQCAKECEPHNRACEYGVQMLTLFFYTAQTVF
jgi:hypothetical protein